MTVDETEEVHETEEADEVIRAVATSPFVAPPPPKVIGDRFTLIRTLGEGGFGIVYEAEDRVDGGRVALKVLRPLGGEWPDRFKREFRALRDLDHPNLIALYELFYFDGLWLFTMELLEGVNLIAYARSKVDTPDGGRFHEGRVRSTFGQLASALAALHAAGKVHRDVKPSNVLVTNEERTVLLDLGLVSDVPTVVWSRRNPLIGTPGYMAPEAVMGSVGPPADMYAVGVMLYELLTGCTPFCQDPQRILLEKLTADPDPVGGHAGVPGDLGRLASSLLDRDPRARPSAVEVVERLAAGAPITERSPLRRSSAPPSPPRTPDVPLVGRRAEHEALEAAFRQARDARAVVVRVHGASGIGKTALVGAFVERLREKNELALVFHSRCFERESVPYKAFDEFVESLAGHLGSLSHAELARVLPEDFWALEQMFPALRSLRAEPGDGFEDGPEPQELRHRAFVALREILIRLSEAKTLVLWLDDVQWADVDSATALESLLRPPRRSSLLVVLSHRAGDSPGPFLAAMGATSIRDVENTEIALRGLAPNEARVLARAMLGDDKRAASCIDVVASEAEGNPFFIKEFASFLRERSFEIGRSDTGELDVSLDQVILGRVRRLPPGARRLLEVVSIAGAPISRRAAFLASELDVEAHSSLSLLRSTHLVKTRGAGADDMLAGYHDRIAETVVADLGLVDRETRHRDIASALERAGGADPEMLVYHHQGATDFARAAKHAVRAAELAASKLAFDRAVRLYRLAIELRRPTGAEREALEIALGDALVNAGQGKEAASVYLDAADRADLATSLDLRRRAGEQMLRSGHVDEGIAIAESVLNAVGIYPPGDTRTMLASLLARRAFLAVRGYSFVGRREEDVPRSELERLDASWSAAVTYGTIDTVRGAESQARHMVLALRVGEPYRVARALCLETAHAAAQGVTARRRYERLNAKTRALAGRLRLSHTTALSEMAEGMGAWFTGQTRRAVDRCTSAERILRSECSGAGWEIGTARVFAYMGLAWLGEIRELRRRVTLHDREGRDRNDRYAPWIPLSGYSVLARLAADEPLEARAAVEDALRHWSKRIFTLQHHWATLATALIDLYAGDETASLVRFDAREREYRSALLFRVEVTRITFRFTRIQCTLAAAGPRRPDLLPVIARLVRELSHEKAEWARPLIDLTSAGLAWRRGRHRDAVVRLQRAVIGFESHEMRLFAAAARRRIGQIVGGDEGRELVARSEAAMVDQTVARPAHFARAHAPGYSEFD